MKPSPFPLALPARMYRLVPSRFDPPVLRTAANSAAELDALVDLDHFTNDRVRAELDWPLDGLITLGARETRVHEALADFANAAFAYPGEGARFHDSSYGCWYAADEYKTAYAEVAYHRVKTWIAQGITSEDAEYSGYSSLVRPPVHDVEQDADYRSTVASDPDDYTYSQALARRLRQQHVRGVTYLSVRRPQHHNVALLFPEAVEDVQFERRYVLTWRDGNLDVRRVYAAT